MFVSLLQQRPASLYTIIKLRNSKLKWLNLPFTTPDIRIGSLLFVLWSCSLDFKVAWLCCCNFHFISKTDSSLQLMNVTHLSRLAYPLLGRGGGGRGLKEKKIIKKEKKSTWKVLTFVVYYRIHLNLNLEASARQWPNNFIPSVVGGGKIRPWETHKLLRFLSFGIGVCILDMNNHTGLFQPLRRFPIN